MAPGGLVAKQVFNQNSYSSENIHSSYQVLCHIGWVVSQNAELASLTHRIVGLVLIAVPHKPHRHGMLGQLLIQQAKSTGRRLPSQIANVLKKTNDLDSIAELFGSSLNNVHLDVKVLSIVPLEREKSRIPGRPFQTEYVCILLQT